MHPAVLLLAIVGALAMMVCLVLVIVVSQSGPRHEAPKIAAEKGKATFFVRGGEPLAGTNLFKMTIAASEGTGNPYGSLSRGSEEDVRNILLIDKTNGASRRILPDNDRRIENVQFLTADAETVSTAQDAEAIVEPESARPAVAKPLAYYVVRVRHATDDGAAPTYDLLVGALATGKQGYVMRSIDGVETQWMRNPSQLAMLVRERLGLYFRVVDIPAAKVVESRRIEID